MHTYILFEIDLNRSYKFSKNTNVTSFQLQISRILIGRECEERKKNTEKLRRFEKFREIFTGKQLESPRGPVWGYGTEFGA